MEKKITEINIRNIAIIAHVDHGKTTLVDALLKQTGVFRAGQEVEKCIMDSNDLERERGITIFSKNAAIHYKGTKINIIDTPGHSDFSGEVERVLKMADGVLLLVDAAEGPLSQTRFVLHKSLELGLSPIVVVNKIDRKDARPAEVLDAIYELFMDLGANEEQFNFPVIYAIGRMGIAQYSLEEKSENLEPLFETILKYVPAPLADPAKPLQMLVTSLDYNDFVGRIAIGKIDNGKITAGQTVALVGADNKIKKYKVTKLYAFDKLGKIEVNEAGAGDLAAVSGAADVAIGDTIADPENPVALKRVKIDEPTISMNFLVNDSPFAGRDGKFLTSRKIEERLQKELESNVSLRVEKSETANIFKVSGRGVLHLSVLIERMRREGFELAVSKPQVIIKEENGKKFEPIEDLIITVPADYVGKVMEAIGSRRAEVLSMKNLANGETQLHFKISSRGLIGFRSEFITMTKGLGVMAHRFLEYGEVKGEIPGRLYGVLVSMENGKVLTYALDNLESRGKLFIKPGIEVYEGMIVGIRPESGDLAVNPCKAKHVSNVRVSGGEEAIQLAPPIEMTLEKSLEFIADDELVEVTPASVRMRKKILKDNERRRSGK